MDVEQAGNEFPLVVYHVAKGSKVVHSQEELDKALSQKWQKDLVKVNERDRITKEIQFHEDEAEKLRYQLEEILNSSIGSVSDTTASKPEEFFEDSDVQEEAKEQETEVKPVESVINEANTVAEANKVRRVAKAG